MFNLDATPYLLEAEAMQQIASQLSKTEERVSILRGAGTLTERTIRQYYGEKRFEQVAESNALEGSTLDVGETEIAVLRGMTFTGHDEGYVKDAIALDRALTRVAEMARDTEVGTDISQLHEIHGLLLGDRPGGGIFRNQSVIIRGAQHTPPETIMQILDQMEHWQNWSVANRPLPAPIRAAVLHAWLTHIHPYIDGNGRVSRAIGNLELIRAGYPPIIIKKKERDRYISALAESDDDGDIRSFFGLIFDRIESALTGLELAARRQQGFSSVVERIQRRQKQHLNIWLAGIKLLGDVIENQVSQRIEAVNGVCFVKYIDNAIDFEDYLELCAGRPVSGGWAFTVSIQIPGLPKFERLAFVGHRSIQLVQGGAQEGGPSLFWSHPNPAGFPKWTRDGADSPFAVEITSRLGSGDDWIARLRNDALVRLSTADLATKISAELIELVNAG